MDEYAQLFSSKKVSFHHVKRCTFNDKFSVNIEISETTL